MKEFRIVLKVAHPRLPDMVKADPTAFMEIMTRLAPAFTDGEEPGFAACIGLAQYGVYVESVAEVQP